MELLDRALQRRLLTDLAEKYPDWRPAASLGFEASDRPWVVNATYLAEHELVRLKLPGDGTKNCPRAAKITAKGLDFLQEDGGLTAILGVITVRLDAETIRDLIDDKVEASDLSAEDKSRLKGWLSTAGTEGLKEATKRLVNAGLDHAPQAIPLLLQLATKMG